MFKNMNLPNKLTVLRMILVPVFIIIMALTVLDGLSWLSFIALVIYIIASVTDFVDGRIARSNNLITDFGKVMDPLADKMLVCAGFIMLTYLKVIPGWIVAIILVRDFYVDGLRMLAMMKNKVVPAYFIGKVKTFFEMVTIVFALISVPVTNSAPIFAFIDKGMSMPIFGLFVNIFTTVCTCGTLIVTVISIFTYSVSLSKIITGNDEEERVLEIKEAND